MKRWLARISLFSVLLIYGSWNSAAGAKEAPPLPARIVFLGDSITYSGQYVEYFETYVRLHYPGWHGQILNLGLPSETVSGLSEPGHAGGAFPRPDLHERLDRVLAQSKPDLVIACYGMNDGIYLPFSPERFERFQNGIRRLRDKVTATGAAIIHLTPPTFEPAADATFNYNDVLDRYSDWLLSQRTQGWTVLDVHGPMTRFLAEQKKHDPAFHLAGDGVHPGETGHWLIALPLLEHFGKSAELGRFESARQMFAAEPNGLALLALVEKEQRILKDAWLTETRHLRPGMNKGLPFAEAEAKAAELQGDIKTILGAR